MGSEVGGDIENRREGRFELMLRPGLGQKWVGEDVG